jgi:bifunctional UDP-N-acetylglucosamine pyrophosphorylase / glucosamine-1-phosphate N-acetyltransferase
MKGLNVVVLAAGKGERMLSRRPKVMHEIMGRPMIGYVIDRARELSPSTVTVVLGHGREVVERYLGGRDVAYALQKEQKGTAHALLTAASLIEKGDVLVLYGDVPLIAAATLQNFLDVYKKSRTITFMITDVGDPKGYGRVILDGDEIVEIVEEADATADQRKICTINTGICVIPGETMQLLRKIKSENKKGEYYLTDICKVARAEDIGVKGYNHPKPSEVLGINTRKELLDANTTMRERVLEKHLSNGVTLLDRNVYIDSEAAIGRDTVIYPNCYVLGNTVIGNNVVIGPNAVIRGSNIHDNVTIEAFVVMEGAEIEEGAKVGPFTCLRPGAVIGKDDKTGSS